MGRGRRQQAGEPARSSSFARRLGARLVEAGMGAPPGVRDEPHIGRLGALTIERERWDRLLDATFLEELSSGTAESAYTGLGWAASAYLGDAAVADLAAHARDVPGEAEAVTALRAAWPALTAFGAPPRALWRAVLGEGVAEERRRYASDGLAGDAYLWERCAVAGPWRMAPPLADEPDEFGALMRALAHWRAVGEASAGPDVCDTLDVRVARPDTLRALARFARVEMMSLSTASVHSALSVLAPLRVRDHRIEVRAHLLAPDPVVAQGKVAFQGWAAATGSHALLTAPDVPLPAASGLGQGYVWESVGWHECAARALTDAGAADSCTHEDGQWRRNDTDTAIVLDCPSCGRTRIALCWRDQLPVSHPAHVAPDTPEGERLAACRIALGQIGTTQPLRRRPWAAEELLPARFADGTRRAVALPTRRGSVESQLTRRR